MRAVVFSGYQTRPVLTEVAEPVCPDGGAVLAVRATGVCRSDWHGWMGHEPVALPHIPGHEMAGTVAEVGTGVTRWRVGDRVTVPFVCGCGACEYCRAGDTQVCPNQTQPGFTHPGSFAERVAIHAADQNLVRLPDAVGFVAAASLGCRFATAFRALTAHAGLGRGDWLAVHGCGGVGMSAVMIGVALGARVLTSDVDASARERALELGADLAADPGGGEDVAGSIRRASDGGAHVSVDAFGSAETAAASVRCLRRRGRHVQVGLLFGADATPAIPMDVVLANELEIYGSHGISAGEYPSLLSLIADRALRPERLVGRVVGLAAAGAALAAMDRPPGPPPAPSPAGVTVVEPSR